MKAGDKFRDSQGDTWTVQVDGSLMWDESAGYDEPLFHSLAEVEVGYGPIRPVGHGAEARIWCDRNGEVWKVAHDGSLHPLDVDLDELDVNPHEVDDPQIGHDHDPVNHPQHYQSGGMEAIDVIDAFFAHDYHLGNVFKYLARAGKKDNIVQDLEKAAWYLSRAIEREKES